MNEPRLLAANEVEFRIECHPEDTAIAGNCSAIDEETDAAAVRWIRDELERGNEWAWCCVVVRARWNGFEGRDSLGCCSYRSEEEFTAGGYYDDMKEAALDDLNNNIARTSDQIDVLRK